MNRLPTRSPHLHQAAAVLRSGGLVAFPTETVYGLGADARNPEAVARIFAVKGRPADHPLIVHLAGAGQLTGWARDIPGAAWQLAEAFWPGPLTLVLRRLAGVPDAVTGGQDTVGLRVPDHPMALALLRTFGDGIAAPSANRFGYVSPTTAAHVREELGARVGMILDGGPCRLGIESTIVGFSDGTPVLLRPGAISVTTIETALGVGITCAGRISTAMRAPGMLPSHYAPATPLEVWPLQILERRLLELARQGSHVAILQWSENTAPKLDGAGVSRIFMPGDAAAYAQGLYATLRRLDRAGFDRLLAQEPPPAGEWLAVADRLRRAAAIGHAATTIGE